MCGGIGGGGPNGLIDLEGYCWVLEGSGGIEKQGYCMTMNQKEGDILFYLIVDYMHGRMSLDYKEREVNCKLAKRDHWKLDEINCLNKKL